MTTRLILISFFLNVIVLWLANSQNSSLKIIIVAGQSNALNWHADAALLDTISIDSLIKYYYHTGLPPTRTGSPINSTSDNKWTTLSYQTQDPYIAFNKNFFGPEITLAREVYLEHKNLAVIKLAYAGTSLSDDWEKGKTTGNQLYELMMAQIDSATNILKKDSIEFTYEGFFWMQGESDAASASYANDYFLNLLNFVQDIRTDLSSQQLKFILGRIGNTSSYAYKHIVRTAQVNVADSDSLIDWVNTDDLPLDTDNIHLLAEGEEILGKRMALAWKDLNELTVSNEDNHLRESFKLLQNYPNPFNPNTIISFSLGDTSPTKLAVYNLLGQEVNILINRTMRAGKHRVSFNADNLPSGVYVYRLTTNKGILTKKMIFLK
jgi:hypothetical protein